MKCVASMCDRSFVYRFESCELMPEDFDHKGHLRLAYVYLVDNDVETSVDLTRESLSHFLSHHGIKPSEKYHETLTRAWILAVWHFMNKLGSSASSEEMLDRFPEMLDSKIMLTHYSEKRLFSDQAKLNFVEPDLDPIPRHLS